MAKGYWLTRVDGIFATQKKPWAFDRFASTLPRRGKNNHTKQFFVPEFECTEDFRDKNIPVQQQLNSDVLDQLVANVNFTGEDVEDQSLNRDIKKARLGKLIKDTQLIGERLQQRKRQLYYDWSERFFNSFAEHFGKLKNLIVELHLNEEQVKTFNQCLDKCMQNMELDLNSIWDQFKEQQNEQKESSEV